MLGLAITFTVTIVGLATVVDGVGLGDSVTRDIAIVALAAVRARGRDAAARRPAGGAAVSRLARFGPQERRARVLVRASPSAPRSGFVYAPCAGPILAAVVSVGAASGRTVAVGLAYALGSAAVLLVLALAGRAADASTAARAGAAAARSAA